MVDALMKDYLLTLIEVVGWSWGKRKPSDSALGPSLGSALAERG